MTEHCGKRPSRVTRIEQRYWMRTWRSVAFWFVVLSTAQATAGALEVRLKQQPSLGSPIVRLGHLADLAGVSPQRRRELESIEVCPAPDPGDRLVVDRSDVRRLLILEGEQGSSIRFTGPERVTLQPAHSPLPSPALPEVAERVKRAIELRWRDADADNSQAKVELVRADLPDFLDRYEVIDVNPVDQGAVGVGRGTSRYQVVFARDETSRPYAVEVAAQVTPVIRGVVPTRPIARGEVLGEDDVRVAELTSTQAGSLARGGRLVTSIEEVVGKEAQRPLRIGNPIDRDSVKAPLVIKRRDEVVVVAKRDGFTARITATALKDARLGETVELENIASKERFVARAVGPRTAEILAFPSRRVSFVPKGENQ